MKKEVRYNRLRILSDGQINAYVDCCVVEDGDAPTILDHCKIELSPLADVEATLARGQELLGETGFDPVLPRQLVDGIHALCELEHTSEAKLNFRVARAKTERKSLLEGTAQADLVSVDELTAYIDANSLPVVRGIHKECCMSLVDVLPDGQMLVRLRKCVVEDGEIINRRQYHRFTLHPMSNVQATINVVANNLSEMGCGSFVEKDSGRVRAIGHLFHTPRVASTFKVNHYGKIVADLERILPESRKPGYDRVLSGARTILARETLELS